MRHLKALTCLVALCLLAITLMSCGTTKQPATKSTTTQSKTNTYTVGQTAKDQNLAVTVYGFKPSTGDEVSKPSAGNQYIVVDVGIANNGTAPMDISAIDAFSIKTPNGHSYDLAMYFPEPKYPDGTIQANSTARGNLAFEVPANIGPMNFVFDPITLTGSSPVTFRLQ